MDKKKLLLDLYNAASSEDVYRVVMDYGIDGPEYWLPYGGNPNNAGTFENQQSSPENALVEKITNSIDAILMKECYIRGIDPKAKDDPNVPQDMSKAVEVFYGVRDGKWENVSDPDRNAIAQNVQIILTEDKKTPNVAIFDAGEGQNPSAFSKTFLSIARGNKNDVPFVQGKYNFGATGAVVFCGDTHRYQMIISRRNTVLSDGDGTIGFTLVRRHILSRREEKEYKLTWYEYLVIDDEVPSIPAEPLNLGLNKGIPFESGSVVKMYSYQLTRASNATLDLWRELNPLLFVPAFPILIYEARDYKQHTSTKLMQGNRTRLALDGRDKVVFTKTLQTTLFDSVIPITVYILSRDTDNPEFIKGKSVIYTLNGQTQGSEPKTFITHELGFRNLREYILVCVDCSFIGTKARQELFMASRDRLKQGKYYNELRDDIIALLKGDDDIKQMDQEYKGRAFRETGEDKDMIESLFSQLKSNQDIKKMFSGNQGAFSFFTKKIPQREQPEQRKKGDKKAEKKKLKRYPTIFKVKGFDTSKGDYVKAIKRGGKGRIILETDVENEFLSRSYDNGTLEITTLDYSNNGGTGGGYRLPSEDAQKLKVQAAGPYNGEIQLIIEPKEEAEVGESIPLSIKMISTAGEQEVIVFIKVEKEAEPQKEKKPKTIEEPELALPKLIRVVQEGTAEEATWAEYGMNADSIVKLTIDGSGAIEAILINMDSNLVKKLVNKHSNSIERVRNRYLTSVYSHSLMVYTTMYGYYEREDNQLDPTLVQQIQDNLSEAVEFSFRYYANFLMTFEDMKD